MAPAARSLRSLAHDLHAHEPLGAEGRAGSGVHLPAGAGAGAHPTGSGGAGQHDRAGASGRHGGPKKNGPQAIGRSRGGWTTKIHLVAADERTAVAGALSPGQAGDGPQGRQLLRRLGPLADHDRLPDDLALVMDRAYEGDETRDLAAALGYQVVVPPRANRREPWDYDRELYKRRNEVERLFRRLKGFRRVYTRFDKLDAMYWGFIQFALIVEALRIV